MERHAQHALHRRPARRACYACRECGGQSRRADGPVFRSMTMAGTQRNSFCGSPVHALSRRGFLGAMAAGTAAFAADMTRLDVLAEPALAGELKKQQKRVILLWLAGGSRQLETLDPKPGAPTGGPS